MKPNMLPEGARRAPNEGLKASGTPLGAMWAQSGRQESFKSLLVAARGKAEGGNTFIGKHLEHFWAPDCLFSIWRPAPGQQRCFNCFTT